MALELIQMNLKYFEGNDATETLVDPYMIVASIYMQTNRIAETSDYLKKAETVIKALSGDISEKMLEIYTLRIQICMVEQKYQEVISFIEARSELALKLFGIESEQYTTYLEEEVLLKKDFQLYNLAVPLLEKLIRILRDIHGGENHQKVL